MIGNSIVSHVFDLNKSIFMCRIIPRGLWQRPWDPRRHHCYIFSSQVVMELYWVLWRFLGHRVIWLTIHIVSICGYDLSCWHGSTMYLIMAMIVSIIHGSIVNCFGGHALFILSSMDMPPSRMIYIYIYIYICLQVLPISFSHSYFLILYL